MKSKQACVVLMFILLVPLAPQARSREPAGNIQEEMGAAADRLDVFFRELSQAVRDIPRESFDTRDVVRSVGRDPIALFHWVRDNTSLVPYHGSLKGPVGVLLDRKGNSLDRALLLFDLLKKAGQKVRLASGTLTEDQADMLISRAANKGRILPWSPDSRSVDDYRARLNALSEKRQMDMKSVEEEISSAIKEEQFQHVELSRRIQVQSDALLDALTDFRDRAQTDSPGIREHWWVQWQSEGNWVDLDPSLPDAEPGRPLTEAASTQGSSRIADDQAHRMTVRIIAERLEKNRPAEETVLEQTFTPSEFIGQTLRLRLQPLGWPDLSSLLKERDSQAVLKQTVLSREEWLPVLSLGSKEFKKSSILLSGRANSSPGRKPKGKASGGAGGMMGGFARAVGGSPAEESTLSAVWLEIQILAAGSEPCVIRRTVFDLIGAAVRKKGDFSGFEMTEKRKEIRSRRLLGQVDILPMVSFFTPEFVELLGAEYLLDQKRNLSDVFRRFRELKPDELLEKLDDAEFGPQTLLEAALARRRLNPQEENPYIDRLNLIAHWTFLEEGQDGEWLDIQALDILENSAAFQAAGEDAFSQRLGQGVVDTNAEIKPWLDASPLANTSQIFVQSRAAGIEWMLVTEKEDPRLERIPVNDNDRARIEEDLARGSIVYLPVKPVPLAGDFHFAWWRIDPLTGTTLGIGPDGMGQALTGYAQRANIVLQLRSVVNMYADLFRCIGIAVTGPLRGEASAAESNAFIECALKMVCKTAFKLGTSFASVDVNWTNIIIKTTLGWATGKLCAGLAKKVAGT
jgi:hypothetical protein